MQYHGHHAHAFARSGKAPAHALDTRAPRAVTSIRRRCVRFRAKRRVMFGSLSLAVATLGALQMARSWEALSQTRFGVPI